MKSLSFTFFILLLAFSAQANTNLFTDNRDLFITSNGVRVDDHASRYSHSEVFASRTNQAQGGRDVITNGRNYRLVVNRSSTGRVERVTEGEKVDDNFWAVDYPAITDDSENVRARTVAFNTDGTFKSATQCNNTRNDGWTYSDWDIGCVTVTSAICNSLNTTLNGRRQALEKVRSCQQYLVNARNMLNSANLTEMTTEGTANTQVLRSEIEANLLPDVEKNVRQRTDEKNKTVQSVFELYTPNDDSNNMRKRKDAKFQADNQPLYALQTMLGLCERAHRYSQPSRRPRNGALPQGTTPSQSQGG